MFQISEDFSAASPERLSMASPESGIRMKGVHLIPIGKEFICKVSIIKVTILEIQCRMFFLVPHILISVSYFSVCR